MRCFREFGGSNRIGHENGSRSRGVAIADPIDQVNGAPARECAVVRTRIRARPGAELEIAARVDLAASDHESVGAFSGRESFGIARRMAVHGDTRREREDAPAWIEVISPAEADGPLAEVYAGVAGRSRSVANILGCQSLHPEGLRDHHALYRTLMFGRGALSRAERESIAVAVSVANGCHY
jgi:hypothetical protein